MTSDFGQFAGGVIGHAGVMPKYVRPSTPESLEAAIDVLGNRVRVAIIGAIRMHGPSTRRELEERLSVNKSTITLNLQLLVASKVVFTDPPAEELLGGRQHVTYDVDEALVQELMGSLWTGLGGAKRPE